MKFKKLGLALAIAGSAYLSMPHLAVAEGLDYDADTRSAAPIPTGEKNLTTVSAEEYFKVGDDPQVLEGVTFDRDGNLYFCEVNAGKILKLDKNKNLTTVAEMGEFHPSGLAFHPDGRLFVTGNTDGITKGAIFAMRPDGSERTLILPQDAGYIPNDLVFNKKGGLYFTDFKGNMTDPAGGVYYLAPGSSKPESVALNIANANGVALSPDEKILWVADYGRGVIFRIVLLDDAVINRIHSTPVYYFTGRGPDGLRTDADGNLYAAVMSQGKVLVLNPIGIPIGQILLPGRDDGRNLYGASLAIDPESRDLAIGVMDDKGGGSGLFKTQAYASGLSAAPRSVKPRPAQEPEWAKPAPVQDGTRPEIQDNAPTDGTD
ncbi:MAG: SMP-30/gluconolactonase/LRE family protein [Desulfovibrio sp.]|nr:SMP-30/gluconolactonase/LRE family protein [Desulfovibrio sp.]